jgi:hypothetical protein
MNVEPLDLDASITLLRLTLGDDATAIRPASVTFEVQLIGDPTSRRLASVYGSSMETQADSPMPRATVLRFTLTAQEIGLPFEPAVTINAIDRSANALTARAGAVFEHAVSKVFGEWRADSIIRFARARTWVPSPRLTLPPHAARQLADVFARVLREDEPLWLEFQDPVGYLPLVPWEDVLRRATRSPVLRLSPHALQPVTPRSDFTIVLAVSVPSSRRLPATGALRAFFQAIHAALPERSVVHVFADALAYPAFATAIGSMVYAGGIVLHAPPGLEPRSPSPPAATDDAAAASDPGNDTLARAESNARLVREHPWVAWMTRELRGHAADIVHWISPGAFPDEGLLVATDPAESPPEDARKRPGTGRSFRFVPVPALADFLTLVGAWGAIFTALGDAPTRSLLGLRITTDRMARHRPGVAALHDLTDDPASLALGDLYRFLLGGYDVAMPHRAGALAYTHPALTGAASIAPRNASAPSDASTAMLDAYRGVAQAAQSILDQSGPTPGWVAATQRIAEQSASRFVSAGSVGDPAALRGVADALAVLQQVLDAQARSSANAEVVRGNVPRGEGVSADG